MPQSGGTRSKRLPFLRTSLSKSNAGGDDKNDQKKGKKRKMFGWVNRKGKGDNNKDVKKLEN